jgi:NADH:ubiquinone oxidoreductase subunit H
MNLLIPILCGVLFLTGAAFAVGSTTAPLILLVTSTILLIYAYVLHRSQFENDYKNSTWQNGLRTFAPLVLVTVVLALGYGYFALTSESFMIGGRRRR